MHYALTRSHFPNRLTDREEIALAIAKPRGTLAAPAGRRVVPLDEGNVVNGRKPWHIVLQELHAAIPQLAHGCLDVVDLERHLCVRPRRAPCRLEEGEPTLSAPISETARPLFDGFEAQLLGI